MVLVISLILIGLFASQSIGFRYVALILLGLIFNPTTMLIAFLTLVFIKAGGK